MRLHGLTCTIAVYGAFDYLVYASIIIKRAPKCPFNEVPNVATTIGNYAYGKDGKLKKQASAILQMVV